MSLIESSGKTSLSKIIFKINFEIQEAPDSGCDQYFVQSVKLIANVTLMIGDE